MWKRLLSSAAALELAALLGAAYYRVVGWTNRLVRDPAQDFYAPFEQQPAIIALWHGEHFLMPFFGWRTERMAVLVTTHRDGEILARGGRYFGIRFVRGSGDHGREFLRKKAVRAFATMLRLLKGGTTIVATADVPKVARVAGLGLVMLAKYSGRPIVPVAMATSRCRRLDNWDRTCINLPFGRMSLVRGEPISVPREADAAGLEAARARLQASLDAVTSRAYELVGAPGMTFQAQAQIAR